MNVQKEVLLGEPTSLIPKHALMGLMLSGMEVTVVDPEGEYTKLLTSLATGGRKFNRPVADLDSKTVKLLNQPVK